MKWAAAALLVAGAPAHGKGAHFCTHAGADLLRVKRVPRGIELLGATAGQLEEVYGDAEYRSNVTLRDAVPEITKEADLNGDGRPDLIVSRFASFEGSNSRAASYAILVACPEAGVYAYAGELLGELPTVKVLKKNDLVDGVRWRRIRLEEKLVSRADPGAVPAEYSETYRMGNVEKDRYDP